MIKKQTVLSLLLLLPCLMASGRERINLNRNWNFTPGYEVKHNVSSLVQLPHTWNLDAMSGTMDYYRGFGNYKRSFNVPSDWKNQKVFLRFGAVNHTATVLLNGKTIGEHQGGYTAFGWDVTENLKFGAANTLEVRASNALDLGVMPLVGDFNFYGGIYRDVELIVTPQAHISLKPYASSGVRVIPVSVSSGEAVFRVRVKTEGNADLKIQICDAAGKPVAEQSQKGLFESEREVSFAIKKPRLWNGIEDPYQYTARVVYGTDTVAQRFGLRYWDVDSLNHFSLNGKRLEVHGVGRHQEFADLGNAVGLNEMKKDIALMLDMGVNAVRLTHYPHDPRFIDLCDEAGIIVWCEIPFVGPGGYRDKGFVDTERFKANGKHQLSEMIEQYYNHPSILCWGLFNELKESGDNPIEYVKVLNRQAKADDPSRPTVAASNDTQSELNLITDWVAFNLYFGWYGGQPNDIGTFIKNTRARYPKMKFGLSEYGAGASISHHEDSVRKPSPTSSWHPEEWQTHFHEAHWRNIKKYDACWGTFVWVMFDFYAAHRTEGERNGINDKGLVTVDRSTPKDAYYFYKANWNKKSPFVYISERRNAIRKSVNQNIKVFSNLRKVELVVNGKSMGTKLNDGFGTFLWQGVRLSGGRNTIEAVGDSKWRDRTTIEINQ